MNAEWNVENCELKNYGEWIMNDSKLGSLGSLRPEGWKLKNEKWKLKNEKWKLKCECWSLKAKYWSKIKLWL
jgi:hypothetical protein